MKNPKSIIPACLTLLLVLGFAGCAADQVRDSKVYQGNCLAVGPGGKTITLSNTQPKLNSIKGESATFDLSKARVGLAPEVGNVIRVAFLQKGERLEAIKVMNVSKQDLRKK